MTRRQYFGALIVLAVSGLTGGVLSTWLLPGQVAWAQEGTVKEVRAERFVLVDETGRERALLYKTIEGNPMLRLDDAAGYPAVTLGSLEGKPGLVLWDAGGPRATLAVIGGYAQLSLKDPAGQGRVTLGASEHATGLWLSDAAGRDRVVAGSADATDTRTGAQVRSPISTITLFDETGRLKWQAP